jgi:hypothetical protein
MNFILGSASYHWQHAEETPSHCALLLYVKLLYFTVSHKISTVYTSALCERFSISLHLSIDKTTWNSSAATA